jgi:DNA-directed RNA polymerase subunit F
MCEICDQVRAEREAKISARERELIQQLGFLQANYRAKAQPIVDELAMIQARRQKPVVVTVQMTPEQEAELRALLEGLIR